MKDFLTKREELLVAHRADWLYCKRCPLGELCINHVLYDDKNLVINSIPDRVDILFIGEAPGNSEDAVGIPFIGTSGKLLRKAIDEAMVVKVSYVITNSVACKPQDSAGTAFRQPTDREIEACAPRIKELLEIYQPKMIVLIGNIAREKVFPHIKEMDFNGIIRNIAHPSWLARRGGFHAREYPDYVDKIKGFIREVKSRR